MAAAIDDHQVARAIDRVQALAAGGRLQAQDAAVATPTPFFAEILRALAIDEGFGELVLRDHAVAAVQLDARVDAVAIRAREHALPRQFGIGRIETCGGARRVVVVAATARGKQQ